MNAGSIHSDVWMHVLSFSNVIDACRIQVTSKRFYYLVSQFQALTDPQLGAALLDRPRDCLLQLSRPPTLMLTFSKNRGSQPPLSSLQVPGAVLLGANSRDVSANLQGNVGTQASVMMASFSPKSTLVPFWIDDPDEEDECPVFQDGHDFSAILVYVCGHVGMDSVLGRMQRKYPTATIVGGICHSGFVTIDGQVEHVDCGVFGVAGNFPARSIVSRGVESVLSCPLKVHEVELVRPNDPEYMYRGCVHVLKPYHRITAVRNPQTSTVSSPMSILTNRGVHADFVGLKRPGEDGYFLDVPGPGSLETDSVILMTDGSEEQETSFHNAEFDMFSLDGEACKKHMDQTLTRLKKQTMDEVILGGIMFSCSGRGPNPGQLIDERMMDATRFRNHFPGVPCLGFYAGGEIGPMAVQGHENVFQRGKSAVQGFTAVFALFIVPVPERRTYQLDDSEANVNEFVRSKLGAAAAAAATE